MSSSNAYRTHWVAHGGPGLPLFGKDGTILYCYPIFMRAWITISWTGGNDVDICAFFNKVGGSIGWSHGDTINEGGFYAKWTSGDNTTGGPETIEISHASVRPFLGDVYFDIHTNWYATGDGNGGGPATITANDQSGNTLTSTVMPATSQGRAASSGDPGVRINFNANGTLKSITSC